MFRRAWSCDPSAVGSAARPWLLAGNTAETAPGQHPRCVPGRQELTDCSLNKMAYAMQMTFFKCTYLNENHTLILLHLTLNMRGPSYICLTRSVLWSLVPWLLASPWHQQPWYWLCRIGRSLSYWRKDLKYLYHINVEELHKCNYMFMVPLKNLARKGFSLLLRFLLTISQYWFR